MVKYGFIHSFNNQSVLMLSLKRHSCVGNALCNSITTLRYAKLLDDTIPSLRITTFLSFGSSGQLRPLWVTLGHRPQYRSILVLSGRVQGHSRTQGCASTDIGYRNDYRIAFITRRFAEIVAVASWPRLF